MHGYVSACEPWPGSGAGSAIAGCTSCYAVRAGGRTTSSSSGSIARRSWPSAVVADRSGAAAAWLGIGARSPPTSAGPWTSPRTAWPTVAGSAPPTSRTIARASARRSWSTSRCRARAWLPCSRMLPASAAIPTCWWWTMVRSSAAGSSTAGPTSMASSCSSLTLASRCRTPRSRASMAAFARSVSTRAGSPAWLRRDGSSRHGGSTTITHRNAHLAMLLPGRGFAGRGPMPRGVWSGFGLAERRSGRRDLRDPCA
jgi:hypothetical protein